MAFHMKLYSHSLSCFKSELTQGGEVEIMISAIVIWHVLLLTIVVDTILIPSHIAKSLQLI